MLETVCARRKVIRIAGDDYPAELVKSKFMKLNSSHIQFVIDCMHQNTTKIRNIKKYLLAVLFNAPNTIDSYYTALVAHDMASGVLEQNGHAERVDHRSYERQGIDQIPTVHLGVAASAMEKRGIRTERGDLNREIEVTNQKLRQLKARISKLQNWLKEEAENTEPPTLADYIQGILSRKVQTGKPGYSQSLYNLKDAAKMLNFLQTNNIMDMTGLDEKFKSMIGEQLDIQGKLKPVERRLGTLKKHLEQADIYFKCKGKKPLTEAEQILFTTAKDYLKGIMNGKTTIPTKTWKEEYTKLTAERKRLISGILH